MLRRALLAAFAAITLAGFGAQAGAVGSEADALRRASERGRLIYDYDGAAWVSTDAMVAKLGRDPGKKGVVGYVVEPAGEGTLRAIYYGMDGATPRAVFVAEVRGRKVVSSRVVKPGDDGSLSPLAQRLIAARDAATREAVAKNYGPCVRQAFNSVALPPSTPDGPVSVYLLTPQVKQNEYSAGGHYEIDVGADGRVVASRPFTKSCMALPGGGKTVGLMMSHLLDPIPTEIHVFLSLSSHLPVFVVTNGGDRIWKVEGDKITRMEK